MPRYKPATQPFELAPFLLRYAPLVLIAAIILVIAWHRWSPIGVKGLPPEFNLVCNGTISSFVHNVPQGGPQSWQPIYHVDLPHRRIDDIATGKHIRVGSVDTEHGALWVEDSDTKKGRNIVSYFYNENRLAGSLVVDTPGYQADQVKKATCVRTPA